MKYSNNVDYQEHISIKVGRFLLSRGFDLADCEGQAINQLVQSKSLGILYNDPEARPKTYLFGLIKRNPRWIFLGVVWFRDKWRDASEQNPIFEIYGRKHIDLIGKLAEEMASTFSVKITLRLVCEQTMVEGELPDYDY